MGDSYSSMPPKQRKSSLPTNVVTVINVFVGYSHMLVIAGLLEYTGHKDTSSAVSGLKQCFVLAAVAFCLGMVASSKKRHFSEPGRVVGMIMMAFVGTLYAQQCMLHTRLPEDEIDSKYLFLSSGLLTISSGGALILLYR